MLKKILDPSLINESCVVCIAACPPPPLWCDGGRGVDTLLPTMGGRTGGQEPVSRAHI